MFKRSNNAEFSPCIITQVKYALGINRSPTQDTKTCSDAYWNEAVEVVGKKFERNSNVIEAKKRGLK